MRLRDDGKVSGNDGKGRYYDEEITGKYVK